MRDKESDRDGVREKLRESERESEIEREREVVLHPYAQSFAITNLGNNA